MLLNTASREDAVFPKSRYHQELKKPYVSKQERTFRRATLPQCHIILRYIKSGNNSWSSFLSVPFPLPSYATHDLVHFTTILNIIRQLIAQERLLPLKYQKIQTRSLSMATSLSCFSIPNSVTDLPGQRPQGFAHHHHKNPIFLLKGQRGKPSVGISATQISLQFLPF